MFSQYFQQELASLRDLAKEFAKAYPSLAPMLEGPSSDPDVERVLEGVAFLTGMLREKLDDEFPEIVQGLMQLVFPHYLRPIPSATIVSFAPKISMKQSQTIPAGVKLASQPIDGTQCTFSTCFDVEAHPLKLTNAVYEQQPGRPPSIVLSFELIGLDLSSWDLSRLRLHLGGGYPEAANIYQMLMRNLKSIRFAPAEGGRELVLPPDRLQPVGFGQDEAMLPYPAHAFPGYRILQEFFILPQKFLFLDILGWEQWRNRGDDSEFKIHFELDEPPASPPKISRDNFVLFATPAVNVFKHEADPISLDHKRNDYTVRPSGQTPSHYQIYSVDRVSGYRQGTVEPRQYDKFEMFEVKSKDRPTYHVAFRKSPLGNLMEARLSFTYPRDGGEPVTETLTVDITCTNGELAEKVQVGDLSKPTSTSPDLLEFRNIRTATASVLPPLGKTLQWQFLALYSLNFLSLAETENVKSLLKLYIFTDSRDQATTYANTRRVEGIEEVRIKPEDRLVKGHLMRGQEIKMKMRSDHFASDGDLFLFGSVLDRFFASYSSITSFTTFKVEETLKGDVYKWQARIGDRPLI